MNIRKKSLLIKITILSIVTLLLGILTPHQSNATTGLTIDDLPYKIEFVKMDADFYLTMAIDSEGYLWGWGHSNHTVFGDNSTKASSVPKKINSTMKFKDVAVSDTHILAIDENDYLYAWGGNDEGELGIGSISTEDIIQPQKIKGNTKFTKVYCDRNSSMAIDIDGNLWSWGSRLGRLGLENITEDVLTPQKVSETIKFSKVSIGTGLHRLALDREGNLYSWGYNNFGQLGNGESNSLRDVNVPTKIMNGTKFKEIETGTLYSMAIDVSGNIWTWGANSTGQLGNGTNESTNIPTQITTGKVFNKISSGATGLTSNEASYAIDSEGHLWSWGNNEHYTLGNGTTERTLEPTKVMEQITFKEITAGQLYAIGIDTNGNSWSWGYYAYGAKGTGYYAPENKPIRFTGPDYVVTFKDNGQTLKQESVKFNKPATAPEVPTREGYTLSWDKEYNHIMEDTIVNAVWTVKEEEYSISSKNYNIDLEGNTITKVSPETNVTEFLNKIETNGQKKVVNAQGQEVREATLVGTGYKLQVTFKGEVHTYEIAVRGDIDGNGKITTTDLSMINQQILHKIELTGIRAKAADTDYNGRLTTTDLSMINQAVLRKITL